MQTRPRIGVAESNADLETFTGLKELPTGGIVNGAQGVLREMPAPVLEDAIIGPGSDDFGEKQVVLALIVRFRNDAAFQPGDTTFNERRFDVRSLGCGQFELGELIHGLAGFAAGRQNLVGDLTARDINHKFTASFDQLAGIGVLVDDDRNLRRVEIQGHDPGGRHGVSVVTMSAGNQRDWTMVEEQVGLCECNGLTVNHGYSVTGYWVFILC